jgi:hypothetical protein
MTHIPWYEDDFEPQSLVPDLEDLPERTVIFRGWLRRVTEKLPADDADNKEPVYWRLYSIPYCREYIEFNDADVVLWRKQTAGGKTPNSTIVWIKDEAPIKFVQKQQLHTQAGFLQGPIAGGGVPQMGAGAGVPPPQGVTMWPNCGGTSVINCGGTSVINCGGTSVINCGGTSVINCGGTSVINCGGTSVINCGGTSFFYCG